VIKFTIQATALITHTLDGQFIPPSPRFRAPQSWKAVPNSDLPASDSAKAWHDLPLAPCVKDWCFWIPITDPQRRFRLFCFIPPFITRWVVFLHQDGHLSTRIGTPQTLSVLLTIVMPSSSLFCNSYSPISHSSPGMGTSILEQALLKCDCHCSIPVGAYWRGLLLLYFVPHFSITFCTPLYHTELTIWCFYFHCSTLLVHLNITYCLLNSILICSNLSSHFIIF